MNTEPPSKPVKDMTATESQRLTVGEHALRVQHLATVHGETDRVYMSHEDYNHLRDTADDFALVTLTLDECRPADEAFDRVERRFAAAINGARESHVQPSVEAFERAAVALDEFGDISRAYYPEEKKAHILNEGEDIAMAMVAAGMLNPFKRSHTRIAKKRRNVTEMNAERRRKAIRQKVKKARKQNRKRST